MKLLSVNVSEPKDVPYRGGTLRTGIYKQPVAGRLMMRTLNLDGDGQADLKAHGGPDKAVYAYPFEHYATWAHELGRDDLTYGQFGENLTVEGLLEDAVSIGDRYRIGSALVEVTQPRAPCFKLAHKMGLSDFAKTLTDARRTGFYLRVLEEGEVGAGDSIECVQAASDSMTIQQIFHLLYFDSHNVEAMARAAALPALATSWREAFEHMIRKDSVADDPA